MTTFDDVKQILSSTLQLGARGDQLKLNSPLAGAFAEFDSMALVTILTNIEEHFGFEIEDDEINGEIFESVGSLVAFVDSKLA
jgi:acyl carrier protein